MFDPPAAIRNFNNNNSIYFTFLINIDKMESGKILVLYFSRHPVEKMLILKNRISGVIKKERARERTECIKNAQAELREKTSELKKHYEEKIKQLSREYNNALNRKISEIEILRNELDSRHKEYQALRLREKQLDDLSAEFQHLIEDFGLKVQEAIQPFYRSQAKISLMKRRSDKNHDKLAKVFRKSDGVKL